MVGPLVMGAGHKALRFHGQAKLRKTSCEATAMPGLRPWEGPGTKLRSPECIHETDMEFPRYAGVPND